jgi:hypothetical protein
MNRPCFTVGFSPNRLLARSVPIAVAALLLGLMPARIRAQSQASTEDLGGCTLKDHVYHCDGAVFEKALAAATTVRVEAHNADGVARSQLGDLVKKLGKTIVAPNSPADLSFLMIPVDDQGVINDSPGGVSLGTLRIYTVAPDGSRGHLLWAETFSGDTYMPWPAVVRGLILQFQARFKTK